MKKRRCVHRMNIRLDTMTMGILCQALTVRYKVSTCTDKERARFIRLAVHAYSMAVARRERYTPDLLACDLRRETEREHHYRTAEDPQQQQLALPDNIVALFG